MTAPTPNPPVTTERRNAQRFYDVSIKKLIVLWVSTLGFYHFYWFYRHWQFEQQRSKRDLSPFWRACFAPFFAYQLFERIRQVCDDEDVGGTWNPGILAAIYIAGVLAFKYGGHLFWSVGYLTFLPLIRIQLSVNELNRKVAPDAVPNTEFTTVQKLVIAGWVLLALLFVVAWMRIGMAFSEGLR